MIERRVFGAVTSGGDQLPLEAGYAIAATALTEIHTGETREVEFTYGGHRFVARAEPTTEANPGDDLSDEQVRAIAESRGLTIYGS